MNSLKTKRKVAFAVFLAFISVGAYYFLFRVINQTNDATALALNSLSFETSRQAKSFNTQRLLDSTKEQRAAIETYSLPKEGIVGFIGQLETAAREIGLDLEISSVDVPSSKGSYLESLSLEIKIDGSWNNVFYFISLLENLPLKIDFQQVNLGKQDAKDSQDKETSSWEGIIHITVSKFK